MRGAPRRAGSPGRRRHRGGPGGLRTAHRLRRAHPGRAAHPRAGDRAAAAAPPLRGRVRRDRRDGRPDLDERPDTSGFVVQNEAAVEPLLALLRQQGRAVPEDVSVVAVCPEQVAVQASVRLTSVALPAQEMGRRAVEQLVAKLDGRGGDEVVLLPPELTVRASSGPAPVR
ncbi:substrate-binding domain-containing protein [Streptomyces albogriseolus]